MIKIAVPTREQHIDDHFGHCDHYTIFTIDDQKEIIGQETLPSPQGCGCKSDIASVLAEKGISLMLAGNMGEGALNILTRHGIRVVRGCSGPIDEVVHAWLQGKLTDSGSNCDHHDCPGHHNDAPLTFKVCKD